jgi:predicted ATPase
MSCARTGDAIAALPATDQRPLILDRSSTTIPATLRLPKGARHQQAKSWELRTAMSYARLTQNQGRTREAYELLAPIYGWFAEGFGTKDLKEVEELRA